MSISTVTSSAPRGMLTVLVSLLCIGYVLCNPEECCDKREALEDWQMTAWSMLPTSASAWDFEQPEFVHKQGFQNNARILKRIDEDVESAEEEGRGKIKVGKKYKKFLIPLLLAYKLKFFTLIPVLIGGLILLTGATGLAGFFFALFAAVMGLKGGGGH